MADHWKSLANKLGAPGVDEPEAEELQAVPELPSAVKSGLDEKRAHEPKSSDESSASDGQRATSDSVSAQDTASTHDTSATQRPALTDAAIADNPSEVIQSVSRSLSAADAPPSAAFEHSQTASSKAPSMESEKTQAAKPKRKSTWDSLARMFNLQSDRPIEPETEDAPEVTDKGSAAEDAPAEPADDLSIFSKNAAKDDANPALEKMFGEPSRERREPWKTKPRMVDDVGWGDDDDTIVDEEDEPSTAGLDESRELKDSEIEEGEPPRRRRRRGRGRRGRSETAASPKLGEEYEDSLDSGSRPAADSLEAEGADDEWDEPEITTRRDEDEDVVGEMPERRSNRRRRGRGRDRSQDRRDAQPTSRAIPPAREQIADADDEEDLVESLDESETDTRDDRGPRRGRRRRKPREDRESAPAAAAVARTRPDEVDVEDADEDGENMATKHRNIPTWADSLQGIIEANTENHRRNEGRGGNRRRGGRR